jgi:hypothetical protein
MARQIGISLAEALRTVGLTLETDGAHRATLVVGADGVIVESLPDGRRRVYTWDDVLAESERQREQRQAPGGAASWVAPQALTHWSALLRIVGQLLDTRRIGACTIDASVAPSHAPRDCQVRAIVDDQVLVDGDDVQMHLTQVRTRQIALQQPPMPLDYDAPRRPWWAFWRRD